MCRCTLRFLATAALFVGQSMADEPMFVRYVPAAAVETFGSNSQKGPEPTEMAVRPGALEIREVVQTSTCGYIDGLQVLPVECVYPGAECRVASAASAAGCCLPESDGTCSIATACLPTSQLLVRVPGSGHSEDALVVSGRLVELRCVVDRTMTDLETSGDATAPHCGVYSYRDPMYDGYTMHFCASTSTTEKFYFRPVDVVETIAGATVTVTPDIPQDVTRSDSSSSSSTDPTPGPTTTVATPAPASLPVGPIVGGVVGGIAGIALLVFLAWFLLVHRKKKQTPPPQGGYQDMQQSFAVNQGPPVTMVNPTSPGYDNGGRASIFKPPASGYYAVASPVGAEAGIASPGSPPIPYDQLYQQQPPPDQYHQPQQFHAHVQAQSPAPSQPGPGLGSVPTQGGQAWQLPQEEASELPVTRPDGELRELQ